MSEELARQVGKVLRDRVSGTMLLVLFTILLVSATVLVTLRVQKVTGTEVGVKVNNISGNIEIIRQPGTNIYCGLISTFHVLDKTTQRLEMTKTEGRGERSGQDDLRIKTTDGSDVSLDLTINYGLDLNRIEDVVLSSGPGNLYKTKWVRDFSRSVCRTVFGELTIEEFYNTSLRNQKGLEAKKEMNGLMAPYGILVSSVIAEDFRFHPTYEAKILEKKEADQGVQKEISQALAAQQEQLLKITEATKIKEVKIKEYEGEMAKILVSAKAEAGRLTRGAEAYDITTRRNADGQFIQAENNAKAILAKKTAEAEGIKKMAEALSTEGGHNLVKLGYAKQIGAMTITGQPYTISGTTERFAHTTDPAAATPPANRPAVKGAGKGQ